MPAAAASIPPGESSRSSPPSVPPTAPRSGNGKDSDRDGSLSFGSLNPPPPSRPLRLFPRAERLSRDAPRSRDADAPRSRDTPRAPPGAVVLAPLDFARASRALARSSRDFCVPASAVPVSPPPAAPAPAPVVDPRGVGLEEEGSLSPPSNLSRRHTSATLVPTESVSCTHRPGISPVSTTSLSVKAFEARVFFASPSKSSTVRTASAAPAPPGVTSLMSLSQRGDTLVATAEVVCSCPPAPDSLRRTPSCFAEVFTSLPSITVTFSSPPIVCFVAAAPSGK
mmetsp:Transcript_4679/g.7360  ORF Transcript_4679/g.7360 Transcript_4679/m.7360 type:complete len:282 (-) Transcript_4679:1099-1944(-)